MQNERVADGDGLSKQTNEATQTEGNDWRDRRGFTEWSIIFSLLICLLFFEKITAKIATASYGKIIIN